MFYGVHSWEWDHTWAVLAYLPIGLSFLTGGAGGHVKFETTEEELTRLRKKQRQTRHNEVFGGLSREERAEYDGIELRIRELHRRLSAYGKLFRVLIR